VPPVSVRYAHLNWWKSSLYIFPMGQYEGESIFDIVLSRTFDVTKLVELWVKESELRRRYPRLPQQLGDMNIRPYMD